MTFQRLFQPTARLLATGGDDRLTIDPQTELSRYGVAYAPQPHAIALGSCTASTISVTAFAAADQARRRLVHAALTTPDRGVGEARRQLSEIQAGLAEHYHLPADARVVLAASGTDGALFALGLSLPEDARPVATVLVAPEETGTGVPAAAAGRHFAACTATGAAVMRDNRVAGFPADVSVHVVAARAHDGALRAPEAVMADVAALVEQQSARGARVILHLVDVSKTGFLTPDPEAVRALAAHHSDMRVVVDACQGRIDPRRVRGYVDWGWIVLVTGSKFYGGPAFSGAVLVPPQVVSAMPRLPHGLRDYICAPDPGQSGAINIGLLLRWQAALADMAAFRAIPGPQQCIMVSAAATALRDAVDASPHLQRFAVPAPERSPLLDAWDCEQTIVSFFVRDPSDGSIFLGSEAMRSLHRSLNAEMTDDLPAWSSESDRSLARLRCHIGQPVVLGCGVLLRVAVGARPSPQPERALEKISLILRLWRSQALAGTRATAPAD